MNLRTTSEHAPLTWEAPRHFFHRHSISPICVYCFKMAKTLARIFGKHRRLPCGFRLAFGSASLGFKAAAFALTSSITRTNRSQRSRELSGRMTGGGLISGHESLVTSSSLGRNSCSLAWC